MSALAEYQFFYDADAAPHLVPAMRFLEDVGHENLGTHIILSRGPSHRLLMLAIARGQVCGVSVVSAGNLCFCEATDPGVARELIIRTLQRMLPTRITCAGRLMPAVRAALLDHAAIAREHRLLALVLRRAPVSDIGRFAEPGDLHELQRYQEAYNDERRTRLAFDFEKLIAARQVAVVGGVGALESVVMTNGDTPQYAILGGTYTFPRYRRHGRAEHAVRFLAHECLQRGRAVHLIVDDDNFAAIGLYRKMGFQELGTCYMAYPTR